MGVQSVIAAKRQPFRFVFTPMFSETQSTAYALHSNPVDVGARLTSISGGCCSCTTNETGFVWSCNESCPCSCQEHVFSCVATWEGYSLPFQWSGLCPCYINATNQIDDLDEPYVNLGFNGKVLFFENAYTNSYGQVVGSRTTTTRLMGIVYGGAQGGSYSFELADGNRLVKIGESESFGVTNVAPNESRSLWVDYRAASKSEEMDDITATLVFYPNGVTEAISAVAHTTSIEVSTCVHSSWIPYTHRKELGVGETSIVAVEPDDDALHITMTGCDYTNLMWQYRAPVNAMSENVVVSCQGVEFPVAFQTIQPQGIEAQCVFCDTNTLKDVAGNFIGNFDLVMLPTNVSFHALLTAELGFVATNAVGFFALPAQSNILDHSLHGANSWHGIGARNVFYDMVSFKAFYPPWGDGGSFTWPIENAWHVRSEASVTNQLPWRPAYDQRFELDADGTSRIEKFDYTLQQWTNLEFQVTIKEVP